MEGWASARAGERNARVAKPCSPVLKRLWGEAFTATALGGGART